MKVPTFGEAVAISDGGTVYVFPVNNTDVAFIWDEYFSEGDWGFWCMVAGGGAYKVVLSPGREGPVAQIGGVREDWRDVLRRPALRIPPRVFFILTYVASTHLGYFGEPKIVSIKDFDESRVKALAAALKSRLYDAIVEDAWGYDWGDWDGDYEALGEEDPCIDAMDPSECAWPGEGEEHADSDGREE